MTTKEAIEYASVALWSTRGVEAFTVLTGLAESEAGLRAENERLSKQHDQCHDTNTGLIKERDELKKALALCDYVIDPIRKERDALKVEVGQDKALIADLTRDMNEEHDRAEKAEADLEQTKLHLELRGNAKRGLEQQLENCWIARKKAEAELDAARPLLEAADKVIVSHYQDVRGGSTVLIPYISEGEDDVHSAIIAYREGKVKNG